VILRSIRSYQTLQVPLMAEAWNNVLQIPKEIKSGLSITMTVKLENTIQILSLMGRSSR
jgi:hypothetical protein